MDIFRQYLWFIAACLLSTGCGSCEDDAVNAPNDSEFSDADVSTADANSPVDAGDGGDAGDAGDLAAADVADAADADVDDVASGDTSSTDTGETSDTSDADNTELDAAEGDTGDASDVTDEPDVAVSVCGDGVLDPGESCDDGVTTSCATTHDGGDGTCVPIGQCSLGYVLQQGSCVVNPTGLSTPCSNGPGWAMFRFHYWSHSSSAQIDQWDASCSYSLAPNSMCEVRTVCPGFCNVNTTSSGYPILTTTHYLRARFSAAGLNFSTATLWVEAYGYSGSPRIRAWSPIYGDVVSDFVTYSGLNWYSLDWSNHLSPTDQPSLTAFQLYTTTGSVAVRSVELCVQ